jgi:hypothetical protein
VELQGLNGLCLALSVEVLGNVVFFLPRRSFRLATVFDQRRQFARHHRPEIDVSGIRQAFRGHVIDDVQDAESPAARELYRAPSGIELSHNN